MAKEEVTQQNFSGGELSPTMYGRYDLPVYQNGCRRCENFIVQTQGPARYRPGTRFVLHTRRNKMANLIKFEFNDEQAYQLEFTDGYLRFYKDEAIITEDSVAITNITQADPGVVTSTGHGLSDGDEVFLESVEGMTEVNGKTYIVTNKTANTFELYDNDGNTVDTSGFTAYSSGGVFKKIYEITTPYTEANDLFQLKVTQNADTMYIVHPYYEPRKLTRTGHTAWTLSLYTRTNDPFLDKKTITGITQANPGVVTSASHGYSNGDTVIIETVVGMTEVNGIAYKVANVAANTFELTDLDGNNVDTSGFTAYSSAGYASDQELLPAAVAFHESRLWFGGAVATPDKFFGSRSPDSSGNTRYDDFTSGTDADHAVEFSIADAEVNKILWLIGTDRLLFAGTFGSEPKITGETSDKAITPTSVSVRAVNRLGVANVSPINKENIVIYIQRGKLTLRSLEFDALKDAFTSVDRNLVSDEITACQVSPTTNGIKQITWQSGRPDLVWGVKHNGELLGLTFKSREDVSGWHRHKTNSGDDKFLSVSTMPRSTSFDQIWVVVEREINSITRRYVEFLADYPSIPSPEDFFSGSSNKTADEAKLARVLAEKQKEYIHVDCSLTFDGTARGTDAAATLTPGATTGTGITFTASASVFKSTDVGKVIRVKTNAKGTTFGRATITAFTSATEVTCTITTDFDSTTAIAAGSWYISTNSISGLDHLEGRTVKVVTDGATHDDETVSSGAISLDVQATKVHVGLGYDGFLQPMPVEIGGTTGPSQTKPRSVYKVGAKFHQTLGAEFGTDLYDPEAFVFDESPAISGDVTPLFTGVKEITHFDDMAKDKVVYIRQTKPQPCIVQLLMIHAVTDND